MTRILEELILLWCSLTCLPDLLPGDLVVAVVVAPSGPGVVVAAVVALSHLFQVRVQFPLFFDEAVDVLCKESVAAVPPSELLLVGLLVLEAVRHKSCQQLLHHVLGQIQRSLDILRKLNLFIFQGSIWASNLLLVQNKLCRM